MTYSPYKYINFPKVTSQNIADEAVQTVDARNLHAFLGIGKKFADWIKEHIISYKFIENQDFISFSQKEEKPQGGRSAKEYAITLDMAKELCMVERVSQSLVSFSMPVFAFSFVGFCFLVSKSS